MERINVKIKCIKASNFLSFENIEINLSENKKEEENNESNQDEKPQQEQIQNYVVLVGPNGSGKTNVFRLLEFVGNVFINGGASAEELNKYIRNGQNGFDVSVSFVLDEHDRELLNAYLILALLSEIHKKPQMHAPPKLCNSENNASIEQPFFDESVRKKMYEFLLKTDYELIGDKELEITFNINATKTNTLNLKIIYKFTITIEVNQNQKEEHEFYLYQKFNNEYLTTDPSEESLNYNGKAQSLFDLIIIEAKQNNYAKLRQSWHKDWASGRRRGIFLA